MKLLRNNEPRTLLRLILTSLTAFGVAAAAGATMPDAINEGTFLEFEGQMLAPGLAMAKDVEVALTSSPLDLDSVKGVAQQVDHARRTIVVGPVTIVATDETVFEDENDVPMADFSRFAVGRRTKAEGVFKDGVLEASRIRLKKVKPDTENEIDLGGRVAEVNRKGESFMMMGMEVLTSPTTVFEVQ